MVATFHSSLSHCCFDSCSNSIASAALGQSPIRSGCSFRINDLKACCTKEISWASIVKPKIALARMTWTFWAKLGMELAGKMWVRRKKTRSLLDGRPKLQGGIGTPVYYRLFLGWVGDCLLSLTTGIPASEQNLLCFSGRIRAISWDASSRRRWRATSSGLVAFGSDWIGQMTCLVRVITGP